MSVRRLAEPQVQPAAFAFSPAMAAEADKWIAKYPEGRQASAVIPLLMLAQEQEGWVTKAAIENIATMLGMPYIRVLEVATFYTQFQLHPVGTRAHVQVCGTTPCMLRGAEDLIRVCREKIHPEPFHTSADGGLSWEEVECQGACVNAPMVMIFKDTYEDLTPERLAEIIDAFAAGKGESIEPGPQVDRIFSAPEGGLTTLTGDTGKAPTRGAKPAKEQAPTRAAKPKTYAAEGDPTLASPAEAKGPGKRAAPPRTGKEAEKDMGPTLSAPVTDEKMPAELARRAATPGGATGDSAPGGSLSLADIGENAARRGVRLDDKNRPAAVEKPETPDDLKLIAGVGPVIERVLNGLGIFTFAQIAAWKKPQREWVDGYLDFKGRIERDDWVKQAKALAKGGEAEYIRVFGKKPR